MFFLTKSIYLLLLLNYTRHGCSRNTEQEDYLRSIPQRIKYESNSQLIKSTYHTRRMPGYHGGPTKINWSNVVVIITTFNESTANALLAAIFKTWVPHLGDDADILLVTDIDDNRTDEEILPPEYEKTIKAKVHIYRSPARKEGKKLRYKIIDSFKRAYKMFMSNKEKQVYLKIDADSYVIAENLLDLIQSNHNETYPTPVEFGRSICKPEGICYSTGGLYGFNRRGFKVMVQYALGHKDLYSHKDPGMAHEDYFTSYAFRQATNGTSPIINMLPGLSESFDQRFERVEHRFYICNNQINFKFSSIHGVKNPENFYYLHERFYDESSKLKEISCDGDGMIQ